MITPDQNFIIFSAGFNCDEYVKKHFDMLHNQSYQNFKHIVVDDATTDNTQKEIEKHRRSSTIVYRNEENLGWNHNAVKYLTPNITSDKDIIIMYDLDDWWVHDKCLEFINYTYKKYQCWMTYGSFERVANDDTRGIRNPVYSYDVVRKKQYREYKWCCAHPRTFKAYLWKQIKDGDVRDQNGNYFRTTYDLSVMFPMLEMCPPHRIQNIQEILYSYNALNPLNDEKVHREKQKRVGQYLRKKKKYLELMDTNLC